MDEDKIKKLSDEVSAINKLREPKPVPKLKTLESLLNQESAEIIASKLNTLTDALSPSVIRGSFTIKEVVEELKTSSRLSIKDLLDFPDIKPPDQPISKGLNMSDQRWHGGGLSVVVHDGTLSGDGTLASPLSSIGGASMTAGNGITISGTDINFAQTAAYTTGFLFYPNSTTTVAQTFQLYWEESTGVLFLNNPTGTLGGLVLGTNGQSLGAVRGDGTASFTDLSLNNDLTVGGDGVSINTVAYLWTNTQGGAGTVLINDGSGSLTWQLPRLTTLPATGTVNGINTVFTFTQLPTFIVSDNVMLQSTPATGPDNWTWNGGLLQATMAQAPTSDIIGIL